jgi:hypothetical protein
MWARMRASSSTTPRGTNERLLAVLAVDDQPDYRLPVAEGEVVLDVRQCCDSDGDVGLVG